MSEYELEKHDNGTVTVRMLGPQVNGFFVPIAVRTVPDSYEVMVRVYTDGQFPSADQYVEFCLGDIDELEAVITSIKDALRGS